MLKTKSGDKIGESSENFCYIAKFRYSSENFAIIAKLLLLFFLINKIT